MLHKNKFHFSFSVSFKHNEVSVFLLCYVNSSLNLHLLPMRHAKFDLATFRTNFKGSYLKKLILFAMLAHVHTQNFYTQFEIREGSLYSKRLYLFAKPFHGFMSA
jgi:hypothetical protein